MHERKDGLREGIARGLSQACVYCFEAHKTALQLYGRVPNAPAKQVLEMLAKGMVQSASTSTIVFGSYFTVYHTIGAQNIWAGPCSAFVTSFIKIPISNSMRLMQAGLANSVLDAGRKIVRAKKVRGLYSGYGASLLEDIIEFDMRARMYSMLRNKITNNGNSKDTVHPQLGMLLGGFVGMMAAWVTTPFDTVRAHIAVDAASKGRKRCVLRTTQALWSQGGVPAFYRGATIRALSNAIKSALFYMFFESLNIAAI